MKALLIASILGLILWAGSATSLQPATIALPYCPVWPMKVMEVERLGIYYEQKVQWGEIKMEVGDENIKKNFHIPSLNP